MARPPKKKRSTRAFPPDATQPGPSFGVKLARIIISLLLVIGLGLPVAGLGFASCAEAFRQRDKPAGQNRSD